MTTTTHLGAGVPQFGGFDEETYAQLVRDAQEIIARYPVQRSALLPMLHLVQSVDSYTSRRGIEFCAQQLGLTTAEVSAVATFYTQYKRKPNGKYTIGVCTNTLCAIMGGDEIFDELSEHLGIGHDETTPDGAITLERVECNAGCDFAPVVMANWEFMDNQTPQSAIRMVEDLRAGKEVAPTRGPAKVHSFTEVSRVLAGFNDGHADEGVGAGPASIEGTKLARAQGWLPSDSVHADSAPADGEQADSEQPATEQTTSEQSTADHAQHANADLGEVPPATGDEGSSAQRPAQEGEAQ